MDELITLLVDEKYFPEHGSVHIFFRQNRAHQLSPNGRLWKRTEGRLDLRFPDRDIDQAEMENGALVLDWVIHRDLFVIALMYDGAKEMGIILGTRKRLFVLEFCSMCILDLPRQDARANKCVREHLKMSLHEGLRNYEIDHIRNIKRPNDEKVGDELFHQANFTHGKHNLVVKLRPLGRG
jgi:hypothetical protein